MTSKTKSKPSTDIAIDKLYTKKTHHEHILTMPDTYIGSIEQDIKELPVYDEDTGKLLKKDIAYIPGLYKVFDELMVNTRDQVEREKTCRTIKVNIDKTTNVITFWNDGNGIRIEMTKEKIWAPELIFGHLLTSSNYDTKGKTVGGKNGYGAKLANIFSTKFIVETVDAKNKKKYYQEFTNNMYTINAPIITNVTDPKVKSYTKITFVPDLAKFGITHLTDDMIALFKKRVYDIAACTTNKNAKVYLNDELIDIKAFNDFIPMLYTEMPSELIYEEPNDRWKVGVLYDPNSGFNQMSFVNGIWTYQGGTHVTYILEQITNSLINIIKDKHKNLNVKASHIRDNLTLFINCVVEDPAFSSQTKELLTSKTSTFGSTCELSSTFIASLSKTGIIENVVNFANFKAMEELKKTDGKKVANIKGMPKLDDARWAATRKSKLCRLILTEGDSAKSFAIAGLQIIGRDKFGVFPLRGKLLNVREASAKQILNNQEFINIKQIMGLKQNKKYTDTTHLRYGAGILILTDQDVDGSHIKGLIINMFHRFWPSLLKIDGFIQVMSTPLLKIYKMSDKKKKLDPKVFYSQSEYDNWVKNEMGDNLSGWDDPKYYKGLGTSTDKEAKEIFKQFDKRVVKYVWESTLDKMATNAFDESFNTQENVLTEELEEQEEVAEEVIDEENQEIETESQTGDNNDDDEDLNDIYSKSHDAITLAFEKIRVNDRKNWLTAYNKNTVLEPKDGKIGFSEFVHKELIHFSNYDNDRSIPKMGDGMKPSQRKILYSAIKRNILNNEIKVAALASYTQENTDYHHGEVSLQGTIIGMAQNFVGSNNINLLLPNGNFGARRQGGDEASSARYIFTQLNSLDPYIIRKEDANILDYQQHEGTQIEPDVYAPIIPMILVNGTKGIGTGFSSTIPCFNPKDVIDNIVKMLDGDEPKPIHPWYAGFKGTIKKLPATKKKEGCVYQTTGVWEIVNETTIKITELPIGTWIDDYKEFLESCVIDPKGKSNSKQFITSHYYSGGNNLILFEVVLPSNTLQSLIKTHTLEKVFKLTSSLSMTNMHLHNDKGVMTKYDTVQDIFYDFYQFRLRMYEKRKAYKLRDLENELKILENKVRFIKQVSNEEIVINKRDQDDIEAELLALGYPNLHGNVNAPESKKSLDYLTGMSMFSVTIKKMNALIEEYNLKKKEYNDYLSLSLESIWKSELLELSDKYDKWFMEAEEDRANDGDDTKKPKGKGKGGKKADKTSSDTTAKTNTVIKTVAKIGKVTAVTKQPKTVKVKVPKVKGK